MIGDDRPTATQRSLALVRASFSEAGGRILWRTAGTFGMVECWLVRGELRIVQKLLSDGGVEIYAQVSDSDDLDQVIRTAIPEMEMSNGS